MHSLVLYIEVTHSNYEFKKGEFPEHYILEDEFLCQHINDCDYARGNVFDSTEEGNFFKEVYLNDLKQAFDESSHFNFVQNKDSLSIQISIDELKNWDKRVIELNEIYNEGLKFMIDNDYKINSRTTLPNGETYYEYKDKVLSDVGGIRFVLYVEGELFGVMSEKELFNYIRESYLLWNETESFEIAQNMIGDYHY
ncbi:hypothetical protein [Staphylococcus hyicus]|uniref:hypothetical protein n=1 Tax=Staphylococcus hyicus TaxID=1284 RepID=UPI003132FF53